MEEYPFNEMDYLVRENGTGLVLAYLKDHSQANFDTLQSGVQARIKPFIEEDFWNVINRIAHSGNELSTTVEEVFSYGFDVSYHKIKMQWYSPQPQDHRHFLNLQYNEAVESLAGSIREKPEWQEYQQQFGSAYRRFAARLTNFHEYHVAPADLRQEENLHQINGAGLVQEVRFGYERGAVYKNDQDYETFIENAWLNLGRGLITAPSKSAFRRVFLGRATTALVWNGKLNQLYDLVNQLFDNEMVTGGLKGKWQVTVQCFRLNEGPIIIDSLQRTKPPKGIRKAQIDSIVARLRG